MPLLLILFALAGPVDTMDARALTDDAVGEAIHTIREAILGRHNSNRHWDPRSMPAGESTGQRTGGYTALACLALTTAGHPWHTEPVRGAIETLAKGKGTGTYTIALRVLLFASLPERFRPALVRDVRTLIQGFDIKRAGWTYTCPGNRGPSSPSVRHMALLALRAAADAGVTVPPQITAAVGDSLLRDQHADGGWGYRPNEGASGSMTAAAIASLLLATDLGCTTDHTRSALEHGMAWLNTHFQADTSPGGGRSRGFPLYWLYALERTAMETGRRSLANVDWFRHAAVAVKDRLLNCDGEVSNRSKSVTALRQLCFGLLVLHSGRVPLCASVLVEDVNAPPPTLARAFTHALSKRSEHTHSWQSVSIDDDVGVWLEAPMVLIPPGFEALAKPTAVQAIDTAIEHGGTIVFAGRGGQFATAARDIMRQVCPDTRWKRLTPGRTPRGIIVAKQRKPVHAEIIERDGRLIAWLLLDKPDRSGGWSNGLLEALMDAWGTATERLPFPPRLAQPPPPKPLPTPLKFYWTNRPPIRAVAALCRAMPTKQSHLTPLVIACSDPNEAPHAMVRAIEASNTGRPVLLTPPGGSIELAKAILASAPAGTRPQRWWPLRTPKPRWRAFSRQMRPNRAMDLPLLLQRPTAHQGGIVLCPCDVLLSLLERPAWGIHGLQSESARGLLAGLHQLRETGGRDESPTSTNLAPMDRHGSSSPGRCTDDRTPSQCRPNTGPSWHCKHQP